MSAQWQFLARTGAQVDEAIGPLVDPTLRGRLRLWVDSWADRGFAHWCDLRLARAWFRRAAELTREAEERRIEALPYEQQVDAVVAIWDALGQGYRALDLPPHLDPSYRAIVARDISGGRAAPCELRAWGQWAGANGAYKTSDGAYCVTLHQRLTFRTDGTVEAGYVRFAVPSSMRLHGLDARGQFSWRSWAFIHTCTQRMTFGDCESWTSQFFPPLKWYFDQARELAASCVGRGAFVVMCEGLRTMFLVNLKAAKAAGVLRGELGRDTGFAELAGMADIALEDARVNGMSSADDAGTALLNVAQMAGAVHPILGAALGIAGVLLRLLSMLPAAVARVQDEWGRDIPTPESAAFEVATISGGPSPREPPTHTVPDPPGWSWEAEIAAEQSRRAALLGMAFDMTQPTMTTELPHDIGAEVIDAARYRTSREWVTAVQASLPDPPPPPPPPPAPPSPPVAPSSAGREALVAGGVAAVALALVLLVASSRRES